MNKELITALVDGEIKDENLNKEILYSIETDNSLAIDYKIQLLVKNLVREKVKFQKTPDFVREKILQSIKPKEIFKDKASDFLSSLFTKPAFTFATAVIVIFAVILILFNRPGPVEIKDFALEQKGSDNMFVQAKNNFQSIVDGKLKPQFTSENPQDIKNYFASNGVKYSTQVLSFAGWSLVGAVIYEDKGEKFAHHVYVDKNKNLVYLFQVNESYLYTHKIISLSNDLIKYLDEGNCYTTSDDGRAILLTKHDQNIFAVVSNADLSEIESKFCNTN
jgi:hypothetical protein